MHNHRAIVYSCSCMLCAALACTCFEQLYHTSTATGRACCAYANVGALHRVDGRNSFAHKHPKKKKELPSSPLLQPLATTLALDRAFQFLGVASFWAFSVVGCSLKETATLAWPCDLYRCTTHMPSNNIVPSSSPPPPPTPPFIFI